MSVLADATVVVPFRLASTRFPDKPLQRFFGRTLLEHAIDHGAQLGGKELVVTASADDLQTTARAVDLEAFGARSVPSRSDCASATERTVQIQHQLQGNPIVSLPVDEPALDPLAIRSALAVANPWAGAGALTFWCDFFSDSDHRTSLSAKVVLDADDRLLFMSRAAIPVRKDGSVDPCQLKKNVGVFVFQRGFLAELERRVDQLTILDRHEGLEQLRWLELGLPVRCLKIRHIGFGVDEPWQLAALEQRVREQGAAR